ncbi:PQQ-dependent sugar dehydrogenase [Allokutzneria albata]|uniref:Glucose/arabinose dehydrogenase, beta-propeller fold n=1 Tax=Allokutzneria albata TaxID=211114 RepID=A0A1G9YRC5_ALLAB|nr:PQQ-dependent sugar dehydrogenase [Allokutzneria albata]SDN11043.1 Glucose/arabinose dehydrogenase, beta-propeller fold [Allokutzneria albata]
MNQRIGARRGVVVGSVAALTALGTLSAGNAAADVEPRTITEITSGLSQAWGLDFLPDGSALFTEKNKARIRKLDKAGAVTTVQTIPGVSISNEGGLLGIAVSPNYAADQTVFIYYTAANDNRIAKLKLGQTPQPILTGIPRGAENHQGGRLEFGPDGHLYAGTGDAQKGSNSQSDTSLAGKVLRMTVDGKPAPGNPKPGSVVYAKGFRNVQGLAWVDKQLYVSDIGASYRDELNKVDAGKNYGWPTCEGSCSTAGMTNPVQSWPTSLATPSGLEYYKGSLYMASLKGGTYKLTTSGAGSKLYTSLGRTRAVEAAPDGSLYVMTPSEIHRADGN